MTSIYTYIIYMVSDLDANNSILHFNNCEKMTKYSITQILHSDDQGHELTIISIITITITIIIITIMIIIMMIRVTLT